MRRLSRTRRRGFGLIALLVTLAVISILLGTITLQIVLSRKTVERRANQLQALWLARAGVEIAAAQLLGGSEDYAGQTLELIPGGRVRVEVKREQGLVDVTSEATYPADSTQPVVRTARRLYRRVATGDGTRLEVVPAPAGEDDGPAIE